MSVNGESRQRILIADDSEMNRSILADMLEDEYDLCEAENGVEAVAVLEREGVGISLVLLDIVMPEMDGFGVLEVMNKYHWIDDIPVILISAENSRGFVERAYDLGVTDYISRPFDAAIVRRRVVNTLMLYAKQKKLVGMVADQIIEKEKTNNLMVSILSNIVEFRNGESGLHVTHVRVITEMVLKHLIQMTDKYELSHSDIALIATASALHDIGKIAIPEEVLNKPGRLTDEEFVQMKKHSEIGASMLEDLPFEQDEPLVRIAHDICRWHHERYDGRGYPDGLKGDEIPISAQAVALADVYDALTSERVYKKAFSHEKAVQMIMNGECGTFNPLLMQCLGEIADDLLKEKDANPHGNQVEQEMRNVTAEMLHHEELSASERTLRLLEHERTKYRFFASMSQEIQFEYKLTPPMVTISDWGAERLGLKEITMDPLNDPAILTFFGDDGIEGLRKKVQESSPESPVVQYDCELTVRGKKRWNRIICRALWESEEPPKMAGVIGKLVDVHDTHTRFAELEQLAFHDPLTGLLNRNYARTQIIDRIVHHQDVSYALVIIDLDYFKDANDQYGHLFGDKVLQYMSEKLRKNIRSGDIVARVGGDEFMAFTQYVSDPELMVERIFQSLIGKYENFKISVSMGIALTDMVGYDYTKLFHNADKALYAAKRAGRGRYCFYDPSMQDMLSVISPIDKHVERGKNVEKGIADR